MSVVAPITKIIRTFSSRRALPIVEKKRTPAAKRAKNPWTFTDYVYVNERFEQIRRKRTPERVERYLYGLQWELLGYVFEVASRTYLSQSRLEMLREENPAAEFFCGNDIRFRPTERWARDFDGFAATVDRERGEVTIHELYEMKSSRQASVVDAFDQVIAARNRLQERGFVFLRGAVQGGFQRYRVRFDPSSSLARRNVVIVFPADHVDDRKEIFAVPIERVPFKREREVNRIFSLLREVFPSVQIVPLPFAAKRGVL